MMVSQPSSSLLPERAQEVLASTADAILVGRASIAALSA
jgi:hypothetical protein